MADIKKINPISEQTKSAILRKSAYGLPLRPSASGMKPSDIKKAFYAASLDDEDSLIAEIIRVINEANEILELVEGVSFTHAEKTDNPHNVTKAQVGLGKVDNTSDANKPISVLQQYELNKKINKTDVQDNVESIDADKPLSAYRGKLLNEKIDELRVTLNNAIEVALANANKYADDLVKGVIAGAPESLDTLKEVANWIASDESGSAALAGRVSILESGKVDKVNGKVLSDNNYSTEEKNKLATIPVDAEKNVQSDWESQDTTSDSFIKNKPYIPSKLSDLTEDEEHQTATNTEKESWSAKQNKLTFDDSPTSGSSNPVTSGGVKNSLDKKVDKVDGKVLSTNDYTNEDKLKVQSLGTSSSRNVGTGAGEIPMLNGNGKLEESVIPAVAIVDVHDVDSEAEMLALAAQNGDVCIRNDLNKCFILSATPASVLANWKLLKTPTDSVLSVNGKTGAVNLTSQDLTDGDDLVKKEEGKGLSTNDYTDIEKNKLSNIENNAQKNVQSDWSSTDTNSDSFIKNKPTIPSAISQLSQDATHRVVTDVEKAKWNSKSEFDGSYNSLTNKPVANTSHSETLGTEEAEEFSATNPLNLHKVSKTGRYSDLIGAPTIPDGVELVDNLTTADSNKGLSAKQGKILNDSKVAISQGTSNTNKTMVTDAEGNITPSDVVYVGGITIQKGTTEDGEDCIEFVFPGESE